MELTLIASGSRPWDILRGYWGLSYLIDGTILCDTFSNYPALERKLCEAKISVSAIQSVVLTHNHRDHTGGLWGLLKKRPGIDVYAPSTMEEKLKRRVVAAGGHLIAGAGKKLLKENVWLSEEMGGFFKEKLIEEQSVLFKTEKGLVLVVGCSHPGIVSIVRKVKESFGGPSVYGVIGGLHLMHAKTKEVYACAMALKEEGVELVAPTHCTGWKAERIFKQVFGNGFVSIGEGQTLSL